MEQEKKLNEKESLDLIAQMIATAKNSYRSRGIDSMMWGAVIAICSLGRLSEIHFGYKLPFDIYYLTLIAIIPQIFITLKEKKEKKVKSYNEVYVDYIWLGFGITIFLLVLVINNIFSAWNPVAEEYKLLTGKSSVLSVYEFIAPLFLILYGMPTFVTGAACKFKPMLFGGILCWVCCIITVYTSIKIDLLLTAVSAIFSWFVPGLLMKKEYHKSKMELEVANV